MKNGSVLPGSVLIGNFSWESLLEPRISDQLSMSAQKSSLDVMAPRSIGWWFLLTSTTWSMIASATSGDVSKPNFTIFWGNKHPLTSYFRVPSGCQSFDENHHTGSFQIFGHLYRRWGTQPPNFGKKTFFPVNFRPGCRRNFNETARYVDQGGGKRKGAFAMYLEPWQWSGLRKWNVEMCWVSCSWSWMNRLNG